MPPKFELGCSLPAQRQVAGSDLGILPLVACQHPTWLATFHPLELSLSISTELTAVCASLYHRLEYSRLPEASLSILGNLFEKGEPNVNPSSDSRICSGLSRDLARWVCQRSGTNEETNLFYS